jgi:hypothetical protein
MITSGSPICSGLVASLISNIPCSYDVSKQVLTLTGLTTSDILKGATLTFSVDSF